jgi:hypothetical protein
MPDTWEIAHGTDRFSNDADADPDQDGTTNLEEYLAGTHPQSAQSSLKLEASMTGASQVTLRFLAISNRTYSVLYKSSLASPSWTKLTDAPARTTNRVVTIQSAVVPPTRYYRVVTPQVP